MVFIRSATKSRLAFASLAICQNKPPANNPVRPLLKISISRRGRPSFTRSQSRTVPISETTTATSNENRPLRRDHNDSTGSLCSVIVINSRTNWLVASPQGEVFTLLIERRRTRCGCLLHSHRFRQIAWLIDVTSAAYRNVIGQQLQRHYFQDRQEQFRGMRHI